MIKQDEIAVANQRLWEEEVKKGCGFTIPWLDMDVALARQYAKGQLDPDTYPWCEMYPPSGLLDVEGKDVLCLASGGGQQSAVFGLLGARVTVVDFTEGQLEGDRKAAAHYGYEVTAIHADMRDLSCIDAESFDLVHQAESLGYVPDVRQVYSEVARLLRTGGVYRVAHTQPAVHSADWNGDCYRITRPYAERLHRREDDGIEFHHYMSNIFNGLIALGFSIEQVQESPYHQRRDLLQATPGSWTHQRTYVAGYFAIVARKE